MAVLDYKTHPSALYTSRRLDFKNLPESQNSKEINEIFYSYSGDSKQINLEIPIDLDQLNLNEENQQTETQAFQVQPPLGTPGSSKNN